MHGVDCVGVFAESFVHKFGKELAGVLVHVCAGVLFLDDVITSPVMDTGITQDPAYAPRMKRGLLALPTVSICLPGQPEYEEKAGSVEILWPGVGDPVQVNCGISRYGNAWTKFE